VRRLVLLGGGHAHVHVLKSLAGSRDADVAVALVTPVATQVYSGMLPGYVAGHYALAECGIDLVALAHRARAIVLASAAVRIDADRREVLLANGEVVPYDVLSINVGSQPVIDGVRGVAEHAIAVRPLERFVEGWERVLSLGRSGALGALTVVGGGAAGVELAFAMAHRFRAEALAAPPHVRILTDAASILQEQPWLVRERFAWMARRRGIGVHELSRVAEVGAGYVRLSERLTFASDATFWVAGAAAPAFLRKSGVQTDARGFLAVNDFLQSVSHPEVFGAGDCATNLAHPRRKAGVFAVRAGPALAANLRAALAGSPLRRHVTRQRFLALLSCGERYAVGVYGPFFFEGRWVWRWKDRIDRGFLARYANGGA
jgi:pyridine nucleotide-disulfide oxidoreductase family protein